MKVHCDDTLCHHDAHDLMQRRRCQSRLPISVDHAAVFSKRGEIAGLSIYGLTGNHLVAYKECNRQPNGFVSVNDDAVFKALADASRRQLLDRLHERNGQTLSALCEDLEMTRQAVAKHLAILEEANLVSVEKQGREKLHFINAVPINGIAERWINKFERRHLSALSALKKALEDEGDQ